MQPAAHCEEPMSQYENPVHGFAGQFITTAQCGATARDEVHTWPMGQAVSQRPQWRGSSEVLTHSPLQ
jgi:hypothetical protein